MSEEYDDRGDDLPQFGERRADVVFHRFGSDPQFPGDLLMRQSFVTAQTEDPLPLFGHSLHGQFVDHQQILGGDFRSDVVRQEIAGGKALPFVAYLHRLVLEPVENGVLGHSEQVISQRTDVSDRSAVLPNFQKNIVREILGFAPALQHAAGERLHTRGISHVQFVECLAIALSEPLQNQFIRFSVHWSHG